MNQASRVRVVLALAIVYVVWGSTYLAIAFGVKSLPPFGMAAARFLCAGLLLYTWRRLAGAPRPTAAQWRAAAILGSALLLVANGLVTWAEQFVASGLAAMLISTTPIFMVLLEWVQDGTRPTAGVVAGLVLGLVGALLLVGPTEIGGGMLVPALAIVAATFSWAFGSLRSRKAAMPDDPILGTSLQMLCGGAGLALVSLAAGEPARFDPSTVQLPSLLALGYLIVLGSMVGFTAYAWLIRNAAPSLVSTYAYVNPVVAVFLGWLLAGEAIGPRTLVASGFIVFGVALITIFKSRTVAAELPRDEAVYPVLPAIRGPQGEEEEPSLPLPLAVHVAESRHEG